MYFVGLFQHLQDLKLIYSGANLREQPAVDPALVPRFIPPLLGRLKMAFTTVGLLKGVIDQFGGIRFQHVRLFNVDGMRLLLGAGAETLKTLVLDAGDPRGKNEKPSLDGIGYS